MRPSKRNPDELRRVSIERAVSKHAEGSCLIKFGDTHVLCTASLEERVPPWLKGQGRGWVTAEYGMLPRATNERMRREVTVGHASGRTQEIQRLIGRALRAVVDLTKLGERQISIDCDVIQADGGTRTAAITGAWVALHDCIQWMKLRDMVKEDVLRDHVAAVSCGLYKGTAVLDLDYVEDSARGGGFQFRHDRGGRHRRGAGHGGDRGLQPGELRSAHVAGQEGHRRARRAAEADSVRAPTMTPHGILETVLYARDLGAIEDFYRRALGLEPFAKAEGRQVFYRVGEQMLLIFNPVVTIEATGRRCRAARAAARRRRRGSRVFPCQRCRDHRVARASRAAEGFTSKPISNGRTAGARSIFAIPPATAWSSPSRASGALQ